MGFCASKEDRSVQTGRATAATGVATTTTTTTTRHETSQPSGGRNEKTGPSAQEDSTEVLKEGPRNGKDVVASGNETSDLMDGTRKDEMKVLLLGAGESGKSTVLQQLKIIHENGFTDNELIGFIPTIYNNILEIGKNLINARNKFNVPWEDDLFNKEEIDSFLKLDGFELQQLEKSLVFPVIYLNLLINLWKSQNTQDFLASAHSSQVYIMDSTSYFLQSSNLKRIITSQENYKPTLQDVLRSRQKTSGIFDTHISMSSNLKLHFFDVGGQRSERKKWIHCFDNVALIIFCVSLSEYDQFLIEDTTQNRFQESLILFENIVNSRWFARTSVVLFLNKIDLFAEKLKHKPLENYFPDYNGGDDINKAAKYILWRFMQLNKANLNVYPHVTQATDTSNIKLVFAAIKETILENSLKDTGVL